MVTTRFDGDGFFGIVGTEYELGPGIPMQRPPGTRTARPTLRVTLPLAPSAVRGLLNLRGRIVPAVDLRQVLDLRGPAASAAGGGVVS